MEFALVPDPFDLGSVYDVPLNPIQAMAGRDALAKAIYNNLFEWIVSRVNISMKPKTAHAHLIGVLDIYGFEIFQVRVSPKYVVPHTYS